MAGWRGYLPLLHVEKAVLVLTEQDGTAGSERLCDCSGFVVVQPVILPELPCSSAKKNQQLSLYYSPLLTLVAASQYRVLVCDSAVVGCFLFSA